MLVALFIFVTPHGMPRTVMAAMLIRIAPGTFLTRSTSVSMMPTMASRTPGVLSFTISGTAAELTVIAILLTSAILFVPFAGMYFPASTANWSRPAFFMPIYAIKMPMPPPIAYRRLCGIEMMMRRRSLVTVMMMLKTPQMKTIASVSCHVNLSAMQTV